MPRRTTTYLALSLSTSIVLAAGIAGAGLAIGAEPSPTAAEPSPIAATSASAAPSAEPSAMVIADTGLTAAQAIEVALQTVPDGAVVDVDQGSGPGLGYWDVVVLGADGSSVELYIDAATGAILDQEPTRTPLVARRGAPGITAGQAVDIALEAVPGGTVLEVDLELEDGRLAWEALVRTEGGRSEVLIDATSGTVLEIEDD